MEYTYGDGSNGAIFRILFTSECNNKVISPSGNSTRLVFVSLLL